MPSSSPAPLDVAVWLAAGMFPAVYLAAVAHEAGHALAGRLAGFRVTSFGMGTARPLLAVRVPGDRSDAPRPLFYLCRTNPLQGIAWFYAPDLLPSRGRSLTLVLGGVAANALLTAVALLLWRATGGAPVWIVLALANGVLAVTNAIPFTLRVPAPGRGPRGAAVFRSDGGQAMTLLAPRAHQRAQAPSALLALRPLWEAVGDREIAAAQTYAAVLAALTIGDGEVARAFREQAGTADSDSLSLRRLRLLADAVLAEDAEEWQAAAAGYEAAKAAQTPGGGGATLCAAAAVVARARAAGLTGAYADGEAALAELAEAASGRRPHPFVRVAVLGARVALLAAAVEAGAVPAPGALDLLLARYDAARDRCRVDTLDVRTFSAAARVRLRAADPDGAALHYERAVAAARAVYDALAADPEAQGRYADRARAGIVANAARCLDGLGRHTDARTVEALFPGPEERALGRRVSERREEDRRADDAARQGRLFRAALAAAAAAGVAGAAGIVLGGGHARAIAAALLVSPIATGVAAGVGALSRRSAASGEAGHAPEGALALTAALLPWLLAATLLLAGPGR